ncbi:MAG: DUF6285 domain-containing protein [Deltaproteobacteria bacterium]|nr:DUF6285 domain-containing protein [Deltaproteobacteria bacterium]
MQQRPDIPTTLDAVIRFLLADVQPNLSDKSLAFRALIAANTLAQCAAELRAEPSRSAEELARLRALMPDVQLGPIDDEQQRAQAIATLDKTLTERLTNGGLGAFNELALMAHLKSSLRTTLEVTNPRFLLDDTLP